MRNYMAELGIFLSRDFLPYPNKYRAWSNNPVGQVDNNGLWPTDLTPPPINVPPPPDIGPILDDQRKVETPSVGEPFNQTLPPEVRIPPPPDPEPERQILTPADFPTLTQAQLDKIAGKPGFGALTASDISVSGVSADPSTKANGDVKYDTSNHGGGNCQSTAKYKNPKAFAFFDKNRSGKIASAFPGGATDVLLRHEQGHFDLTEIYARALASQIKTMSGHGEGSTPAEAERRALVDLNNKMVTALNQAKASVALRQQEYDTQVSHTNVNDLDQAIFDKYFRAALNAGGPFVPGPKRSRDKSELQPVPSSQAKLPIQGF